MQSMELTYRRGLYLPAIDLWLDPHVVRQTAVVSHAHSDHARPHPRILATDTTHLLLRQRRVRGGSTAALPFGQRTRLGDAWITLFPAGHILGSAQTLVEHGGHRLLYSGDFKLRPGLTAEPAETPRADTLVMETTFGRPRYRFPPLADVIEQIERFCRQALACHATPVLFAYSLGKSQELLAGLASSGLPLSLHPSADGISAIYRDQGVALPPYEVLRPGDPSEAGGRVLIVPPQGRRSTALQGIEHQRTAYLSGWAMDRGTTYRFRCDAAFPLSDHSDYDELLEYVERVQPRQVYTLHGFAHDFARDLRARGYRAFSLAEPEQLPLF